jgi:hypothetical protein
VVSNVNERLIADYYQLSIHRIGVEAFSTVEYNGHIYSTLAGVSIDGSYSCQSGYLSLPTGWIISPDNSDSQTVIRSHTWSTTVVLTSVNAYCSSVCGYLYNYGPYYLSYINGMYATNICNGQILIM